MAKIAECTLVAYSTAKRFPQFYIDNFFDPTLIDQVLAEFPKPGQIESLRFDNEQEIKLASASEASFGPTIRQPKLKQRMRRIARDVLPPIVARRFA